MQEIIGENTERLKKSQGIREPWSILKNYSFRHVQDICCYPDVIVGDGSQIVKALDLNQKVVGSNPGKVMMLCPWEWCLIPK